MNRSSLITLLLSLAAIVTVRSAAMAQPSDPPTDSPLAGTEYYVTFLQNEIGSGAATKFMGLLITSEVATTGVVEAKGYFTKPFSVRPGEITTISVSRELELKESEEFPLPAVKISSRDPIAVFVVNSLFQSTGAYAALPTNLWGTSYTPLTLPNANDGYVSSFGIVGLHDSTRITIMPSANIYKKSAWQDATTTLHQGESYFIKARNGGVGVADLSISDIRASHPIAVLSGHVRTPIAANGAIRSEDWASHQVSMLLPDSRWSKDYISVPARPGGDRFRMVTTHDETKVHLTHYPSGGGIDDVEFTLNRGEIYDSSTINGKPITGPVFWSASYPVLLTQMRTSGTYDNNPESAPAMIPLYGLDQFSSRSVFVAPAEIGLDVFSKHTLTIIAKGNPDVGADDPANPLRDIMLNGSPLHTLAPELLAQRIGTTNYYYARVQIASGGYLLTARAEYPFTATLTGTNGTVARDSYTWALPFWMPAVEADRTAPYVLTTFAQTEPSQLVARFSDRTGSYFSGIVNVAVARDSKWQIMGTFNPPSLDDDVDVRFKTTADPSGPLYVAVRDRAGNVDTIKLHDGVCEKPAYAERDRIEIRAYQGQIKHDSIAIYANECGDSAEVLGIDRGDGSARDHIMASFGNDIGTSLTIPRGSSTMLYIDASPSTPQGLYSTTLRLRLATTTIPITVDLVVEPPASVGPEGAEDLQLSVAPNPITSQALISFAMPLGNTARIRVSDYLGRTIRTLGPEIIAGNEHVLWNGLGNDGMAAPAGLYFIILEDGTRRAVARATIVR